MNLETLFKDKTLKAKAKVAQIAEELLSGELTPDNLLGFAQTQSAAVKAICIEAFEYATKQKPTLADENLLAFVTQSLEDEEPKIKWESARVIGNIAKHFPDRLTKVMTALLANAQHEGTVVRWATAYALGEIAKMKLAAYATLAPKIQALAEQEEDSGVKKKYLEALKKVKK